MINDNLPSPTNTLEFAFTSVNYLFGVFVVAIIIGEVREYYVTCNFKSIVRYLLLFLFIVQCVLQSIQQDGHFLVAKGQLFHDGSKWDHHH